MEALQSAVSGFDTPIKEEDVDWVFDAVGEQAMATITVVTTDENDVPVAAGVSE